MILARRPGRAGEFVGEESALPLSYGRITGLHPRTSSIIRTAWSARRDLNPQPPSPVKLRPSARAGRARERRSVFSALYRIELRAFQRTAPGKRGDRRGSNPCLRIHNPTLWPLSYGHHNAGTSLGRRERPRPSRGESRATHAGTIERPAGPAITTLSRHVEPCFSARWWKKNRPARLVRGRGDFSRSRVTALWVRARLRARHGPPALVVSVPPVLPKNAAAMAGRPAHGGSPSRTIRLADVRHRESRLPRLQSARRPRTGPRLCGGRSGIRAMEGGALQHPGSFLSSNWRGGHMPPAGKQKGSRVWMPPVHGSRGPGPAGRSALADDRAGEHRDATPKAAECNRGPRGCQGAVS